MIEAGVIPLSHRGSRAGHWRNSRSSIEYSNRRRRCASALPYLQIDLMRLPRGASVMSDKLIEDARRYAKRGHSVFFAAQLMGISRDKLQNLLKSPEAADICFAKGRNSIVAKMQMDELHKWRIGRPISDASRAILRYWSEARAIPYTAFGVTGNISELHRHFRCPLHLTTLRYRLKHGMGVEEALTTPCRNRPGVFPPQFANWLEQCRRRRAKEIAAVAYQRLTPTMLRYKAPEHDIRVVARRGVRITVEVHQLNGTMLHRLRFIASFKESGVLFLFQGGVRNSLEFIAFEPDNAGILDSRL